MKRHLPLPALILIAALLAAACGPAGPTATPTNPPPTPTQEVFANETSALIAPTLGDFDPARVAGIDLEAYPVLPVVTERARTVFAAGREQGLNPRVFAKVGDCMTAAEAFLTPFGSGTYDLSQYSDLQPVLDFFGGIPARGEGFEQDSFANPGLATASGFNAASVLDPTWADPNWCRANESPLACEFRVSQPAFAIIMFGTNDVYYVEPEQFDYHLRNVVLQTLENNVVPVLSTFPGRPEYAEKSLLFNQIIIQIAQDYDVPLVNLWLALKDLPDRGINVDDTIHLTIPDDGQTGALDPAHLEAGYTTRNLVTLQALQVLMQGLGLTAG